MPPLLQLLTTLTRWSFKAQADTFSTSGPWEHIQPMVAGVDIETLFSEYGRWVVAALFFGVIALCIRWYLSVGGLKLKASVDMEIRKEIKAALRNNDFIGAGEAATRADAHEDAADFFVQGKDFLRAAESYNKAGKRQDAIANFKRGGQPQRAATILEKAGQYRMAAQEYLQAGDSNRAAGLFMKGKDFRRAAELFSEMNMWSQAGEAFERLRLRDEAAQAYERYFEQEYGLARGNMRKVAKAAREKALFAAQVYRETGYTDKAADLLKKSGHIMDAAKLLAHSGRIEQAASLYLEAKKPFEAAKLFESRGDHIQAARYRAEAALLAGDGVGAADEFAKAGENMRAADLYAESGRALDAAEQYKMAGDLRFAAEQYALGGKLSVSARCYEEAGEYHRAADIYHQGGDLDGEIRALTRIRAHYRLGSLMLEHGRKPEALAHLQKVDRHDPNYHNACNLQGDLLGELGQDEVAMNKYKSALDGQDMGEGNLHLYYKIGVCLEKTGDLAGAFRVYEQILAIDYYFKDVPQKVESIKPIVSAPVPPMSRPAAWRGRPNSGPISRGISGGIEHQGPVRYEIIEEIARGGMGIVYRAKDTVLNRPVAFKILSDNLKNNPTAVKYFLREARAAAALSHQNIVTVFDAGEQSGDYYMAMELVHGETLKSLITRSGPFHEKLIRFILVHSCRGLAYAHEQGIVHRDIKSGNMMLTKDKALKIMDFGLAKFLEEYQSHHTKAIGTPFYMSPEQILGRDLDHRSDLYSLGVTLFECATGTVPFFKGELSYHHLHTAPPQPRALNPNLSLAMEKIILTLLEKAPDNRFQSANHVLKSLKTR